MHEDLGFSPAKQGHKVKDQESQRVDLEIFQIHFFLLMQKNKFFSETQIFAWNESFFSELLITVKVLFFFTRYITSCEWWRREICIFAQLSQLRAIPHPCIHTWVFSHTHHEGQFWAGVKPWGLPALKKQLLHTVIKRLSYHGVWKSRKESHSILRAKRATFIFHKNAQNGPF